MWCDEKDEFLTDFFIVHFTDLTLAPLCQKKKVNGSLIDKNVNHIQ